MKSEKAKEFIENWNVPIEQKDRAKEAVELAEQEMLEKAIEVFCKVCDEGKSCNFLSYCELKNDFINQINIK